jgi:hypothetical protein
LALVAIPVALAVTGGEARAEPAAEGHVLRFEANRGQADPEVRYLARGRGFALLLTPEEALLRLETRTGGFPIVRMRFVGSNPRAVVAGDGLLQGQSNYFLGGDSSRWITDVPAYGKVLYQGIYPGIDLVFRGRGRLLEFDLIVRPDGDPEQAKISFQGADALELDDGGDLLLRAGGEEIRLQSPFVYQDSGEARAPVPCRYVLEDGGLVGFEVAAYDRRLPLVIDPILRYATYLGGSGEDHGRAIEVDSGGFVYVAGSTLSLDFPTTSGALARQSPGDQDAFVAKLSPNGARLIYATYLGGSQIDFARGLSLDEAGNVHVVGETQSTDFPTANAVQPALAGGSDSFVAKLNATGSALVYSTYLGGTDFDSLRGIDLDASGSVVLMGHTASADFPLQVPWQSSFGGLLDAFVAKLDPAGGALLFSTYLGGSGEDLPYHNQPTDPGEAPGWDVEVDAAGFIYLAGTTESTDFPTVNAFQPNHGGGVRDAFVTKFDPTGTDVLFSTYIGRSKGDTARGIAVDLLGNIYVAGGTRSDEFPVTPNAFQKVKSVLYDAFILKLDPTGSTLIYSTLLGGNSGEDANALEIDPAGNAFVAGHTASTDFPVLNAVQPTSGGGTRDLFLAKLLPDGSGLVYSTYLGGSGEETPWGVNLGLALDPIGNAYVAGSTASIDFPVTSGSLVQALPAGGYDAIVAKVRTEPEVQVRIVEGGGENTLEVKVINPGPGTPEVELKIWLEADLLDTSPVQIAPTPFVFTPPAFRTVSIVSIQLPSALPFPGTTAAARLLHPVTGLMLSEGRCSTSPCINPTGLGILANSEASSSKKPRPGADRRRLKSREGPDR